MLRFAAVKVHLSICAVVLGGCFYASAQARPNPYPHRPPTDPLEQPIGPPMVPRPDPRFQALRKPDSAAQYAELLKAKPETPAAHAALIRSFLEIERFDDAEAAVKNALAAFPRKAPVLSAAGDYSYRMGDMATAEKQYLLAADVDIYEIPAHLGLANIYNVYSLYARANAQLGQAYQLDPTNPEVVRRWAAVQPRSERTKILTDFLANAPKDSPETARIREELAHRQDGSERSAYGCRLTKRVEKAELPLELSMQDAQRAEGYGIKMKVGDRTVHLLVDTGTSGIVIYKRAAEKGGLKLLGEEHFVGIGGEGSRTGYQYLAKNVKAGELEFEDCVVSVMDEGRATSADGVIGTDVFASYLVDLDIAGSALRLTPLPKRPNESAASDGSAAPQLDRYVAPEMEDWIRVFRVGNNLYIPTSVNDSSMKMFLLDTGAAVSALSINAAKKTSSVEADDWNGVKGAAGEVPKVYKAGKVDLKFAKYRWPGNALATIDLANFSRLDGVEISGIIGLNFLHAFEIKIDYRDGLVDLIYKKGY